MNVSIHEQIRCVSREVMMRRMTYPKFIQQGKMDEFKGSLEIQRMEAVLKTLVELADKDQMKLAL